MQTRLTKVEFQVMEVLWSRPEATIREIHEGMAVADKPPLAYTTVQTMVNRLEAKGAVVRDRRGGNLHLYAAAISREAAQHRLIDELLGFFGGSSKPVMAHLIGSGKLTLEDVKEAEKELQRLKKRRKQK